MGELVDSEEEVIKEGNISLIINDYNDIFSSFDPRAYLERALSDDFLQECKRAARDKNEEQLELRILIPKKIRNIKEEWKIKKRLRDHFNHHANEKENKLIKTKREGLLWVFLGIVINIVVVSGFIYSTSNIIETILSIFEVPSWFLIWEGMGKIFLESRKFMPEQEFYKKMSRAEINFTEY